jgi:hypothetical protein
MALEMVLNELSLQSADSVHTARQWMFTFVQTVRAATSHRVSRVIRTQDGIFDIVLAPGYPLRRWLNDREVDLEARRYIKSLTTKAPFWDGLPELYDRVLEHEFRYDGRQAPGLGVAYLLESLAISLLSEDCWSVALLLLDAQWMIEGGDIEAGTVHVIHAGQPAHVDEHSEWIQERLRSDVRDGDDLWNRRAELFPSLAFCEATNRQIKSLNSTMLRPVARRLFELHVYCQGWTGSGFDPDQLPARATPESQPTLERYGAQRTFLCPDDVERTFSWHVRLTPHAWRIYFYPAPTNKTMIIGYIGPHLPTARHN